MPGCTLVGGVSPFVPIFPFYYYEWHCSSFLSRTASRTIESRVTCRCTAPCGYGALFFLCSCRHPGHCTAASWDFQPPWLRTHLRPPQQKCRIQPQSKHKVRLILLHNSSYHENAKKIPKLAILFSAQK